MESNTPFPWKPIVKNGKIVVFVLIVIYVGLQIASAVDVDSTRLNVYHNILEQIKETTVWAVEFSRPFVEVVLLVFILDWVIKKFDLQINIPSIKEWNIFNVILVAVMASFIYAALRGLGGAAYLKDLALVVIGFYFGTFQRKAS
jgi:hypothetical protein